MGLLFKKNYMDMFMTTVSELGLLTRASEGALMAHGVHLRDDFLRGGDISKLPQYGVYAAQKLRRLPLDKGQRPKFVRHEQLYSIAPRHQTQRSLL